MQKGPEELVNPGRKPGGGSRSKGDSSRQEIHLQAGSYKMLFCFKIPPETETMVKLVSAMLF